MFHIYPYLARLTRWLGEKFEEWSEQLFDMSGDYAVKFCYAAKICFECRRDIEVMHECTKCDYGPLCYRCLQIYHHGHNEWMNENEGILKADEEGI